MAKAKTSSEFVNKLKECVQEYRKQLNDTRDEKDAAHFFDPSLKKFIKDNVDEFNVMSTLNFERPFMSWIKMYLMK